MRKATPKPFLALISLLFLGMALFAYSWFVVVGFASTPVAPPEAVTLEVTPGTSLAALSAQLEAAGVVEARETPFGRNLFYLWAHKLEQAGPRIKAGSYLFEGPANPYEVLETLTEGRVRTLTLTLPEGKRLDELAAIFEASGLFSAEAFLKAARDPALAKQLGVPHDSFEGYAFPDTYTFALGLSPAQVLEHMVSRFEAAWAAAEAQRAPGVKLEKHEAVTLASIIERETGSAPERPRISCVFHNRLRDGWRLQTDPTVIYAKILRGAWDGNITKADLRFPHPYNTYHIYGLPPGPIAGPGEAALKAALNPLECGDFFFVSRNDGTHIFCDTLDCHNAAVAKWQVRYHRERRGRGG